MLNLADLIDEHFPEELPEYEPAYKLPVLDDDEECDEILVGVTLNFD